MIVYRVDSDGVRPVAVECETPGYPHLDADGNVMFDNTHFASEHDAWEKLKREREAHVAMAGRDVVRARARLREREEEAADAAMLFAAFLDAYGTSAPPVTP